MVERLLKILSFIVSLVSLGCYAAGLYFDNTELADISLIVLVISGIATIAFFLADREERLRKKNDSFAMNFYNLLSRGEYFTRPIWQKAYRDYCSGYHHRHGSFFGIRMDLTLRYLKRQLFFHSMIICLLAMVLGGAAIPFCAALEDRGFQICLYGDGDRAVSTMLIVPIVYVLFLAVISFIKSKKWLDSSDGKENVVSMPEIESSYREGDFFECSINFVVISSGYVHGFDGVKFYTAARSMISAVAWKVERFTVFRQNCYASDYIGDEYRFYIVFKDCNDKELFRIPLDQFQIRMIMDNYFSAEAAKCTQIGYEERKLFNFEFMTMKGCTSPVLLEDSTRKFYGFTIGKSKR
ncbi:MAG: hypothetical protein IIZ03_09710 [Succinivibrionaceae bacterium]|nr:hypothetical protein [Succinivibrionaceae bacterium]